MVSFAPLSRPLKLHLASQHLQLRHASFSLPPSLRSIFPSRARTDASSETPEPTPAASTAPGKGLFDLAQESEAVVSRADGAGREKKKATFVSPGVAREERDMRG